jgi:hypothetical protein
MSLNRCGERLDGWYPTNSREATCESHPLSLGRPPCFFSHLCVPLPPSVLVSLLSWAIRFPFPRSVMGLLSVYYLFTGSAVLVVVHSPFLPVSLPSALGTPFALSWPRSPAYPDHRECLFRKTCPSSPALQRPRPSTLPSLLLHLLMRPPSPSSFSLLWPPSLAIPRPLSLGLALPDLFALRVPAAKGTSGHRLFVSALMLDSLSSHHYPTFGLSLNRVDGTGCEIELAIDWSH